MSELREMYKQFEVQKPVEAPKVTPEGKKPGMLTEIAKGGAQGVKKAAYELFDSLDDMSNYVAKIDFLRGDDYNDHAFKDLLHNVTGINKETLKASQEGHGTAYGVSSGITQFVTAFLPINRVAGVLTKGAKLTTGARIGQAAIAGGTASMVGFDPYEARLSNMIQQVPSFQNPITEYLEASPDDSKAVARLKNGLENALLGIGFDMGIEGSKALFSSLKAYKAAKTLKTSGKPGEEALAAAQEVLAKEAKAIRELQPVPTGSADKGASIVPRPNTAPAVKDELSEQFVKGTPKEAPYVEPKLNNPYAQGSTKPATADPIKDAFVTAPKENLSTLTPEAIQERLINATRTGRIAALTKLEPERSFDDIASEVDNQLAANKANKEANIEVVSDISGEKVPVTGTPEGELNSLPNDPLLEIPSLKTEGDAMTNSYATPQILPKYTLDEPLGRSAILDPSGKPFAVKDIPVIDEAVLPTKLQEIATAEKKTVTGLLDSFGNIIGNEKGSAGVGLQGGIASAGLGGSSGLFFDYNGDGKVGSWEDIGIGLLIGSGGYVGAKKIRSYLHGTPEDKAVAREGILERIKQADSDLEHTQKSYQEALDNKHLPLESRKQVERSLEIVNNVREIISKHGNNLEALDGVLNSGWVKLKYKPLVKIPEGKTQALVQALRDGDLETVSKEVGKDFNFKGISAPEDLKEAIDGLTNLISQHIPEETAKMTRGVVSFEETLKGANELGVNLQNVNMLSKDTRKLSERLLAARVAMNSIKTPLLEVTDQILAHNDPPADLLMKFKELTSLAAAVQAEVKGSQTEVARALNSMKIAADTVRLDFDSVSKLMETQGGKKQLVAAVQKLKDIVREGDQIKVNRYLRGIVKSPTLRFLNELHRTVLLSNPVTHAANISGNFLAGMMNFGEATLAGVFSGRGLGDAKALFEGLSQGEAWFDALRLAKRAWKTSQFTIDPLISKIDGTDLTPGISYDTFKEMPLGKGVDYLATALGMDGALGKGVDASGKFLRTTFDALGAEDEFFKVVNQRAALHREAYLEAYRTAVSEGLEGKALAKRVASLKSELVDVPSEDILARALETTRSNTFTANPKGILGSLNRVVADHPVLQLFIPFTRTPTNLIHYVTDRIPGLTMYQSEVREILRNGTREQKAEIASRWATGGLLMFGAYQLASSGLITGGGDKNMMSKKVSGWQPYSVRIGDKYYSYNRLDPISSFLGLAADAFDILQYADDDEEAKKAGTAALIAVSRNLTSKTMLKGMVELLDAISAGDSKADAFVKNFTLSWVPSGVGAAERLTDPTIRDTVSFMDSVKAKIPGLSETLPPKMDIFGEPIVPEGALGPDIISPIIASTASKDPVRQLFDKLNIDTQSDNRSMKQISKVPLSVEQNSELVGIRGKKLKEALDGIVGEQWFQELNEEKGHPSSKQELIRTLMRQTKSDAAYELFEKYPELPQAIQKRHEEFMNQE
ncbi:hypothetical protein FDZ73_04090 [bacterium]|nr:MAG: hypothetical protein FDZ73_04090 [bacterium]